MGVPSDYVSGATLTSGATFENRTLADFGLRNGTYTYLFGARAAQQIFQIIVDPTFISPPVVTPPDVTPIAGAAPEPGTWAMMIVGFGLAGASLRRRRDKIGIRAQFA